MFNRVRSNWDSKERLADYSQELWLDCRFKECCWGAEQRKVKCGWGWKRVNLGKQGCREEEEAKIKEKGKVKDLEDWETIIIANLIRKWTCYT